MEDYTFVYKDITSVLADDKANHVIINSENLRYSSLDNREKINLSKRLGNQGFKIFQGKIPEVITQASYKQARKDFADLCIELQLRHDKLLGSLIKPQTTDTPVEVTFPDRRKNYIVTPDFTTKDENGKFLAIEFKSFLNTPSSSTIRNKLEKLKRDYKFPCRVYIQILDHNFPQILKLTESETRIYTVFRGRLIKFLNKHPGFLHKELVKTTRIMPDLETMIKIFAPEIDSINPDNHTFESQFGKSMFSFKQFMTQCALGMLSDKCEKFLNKNFINTFDLTSHLPTNSKDTSTISMTHPFNRDKNRLLYKTINGKKAKSFMKFPTFSTVSGEEILFPTSIINWIDRVLLHYGIPFNDLLETTIDKTVEKIFTQVIEINSEIAYMRTLPVEDILKEEERKRRTRLIDAMIGKQRQLIKDVNFFIKTKLKKPHIKVSKHCYLKIRYSDPNRKSIIQEKLGIGIKKKIKVEKEKEHKRYHVTANIQNDDPNETDYYTTDELLKFTPELTKSNLSYCQGINLQDMYRQNQSLNNFANAMNKDSEVVLDEVLKSPLNCYMMALNDCYNDIILGSKFGDLKNSDPNQFRLVKSKDKNIQYLISVPPNENTSGIIICIFKLVNPRSPVPECFIDHFRLNEYIVTKPFRINLKIATQYYQQHLGVLATSLLLKRIGTDITRSSLFLSLILDYSREINKILEILYYCYQIAPAKGNFGEMEAPPKISGFEVKDARSALILLRLKSNFAGLSRKLADIFDKKDNWGFIDPIFKIKHTSLQSLLTITYLKQMIPSDDGYDRDFIIGSIFPDELEHQSSWENSFCYKPQTIPQNLIKFFDKVVISDSEWEQITYHPWLCYKLFKRQFENASESLAYQSKGKILQEGVMKTSVSSRFLVASKINSFNDNYITKQPHLKIKNEKKSLDNSKSKTSVTSIYGRPVSKTNVRIKTENKTNSNETNELEDLLKMKGRIKDKMPWDKSTEIESVKSTHQIERIHFCSLEINYMLKTISKMVKLDNMAEQTRLWDDCKRLTLYHPIWDRFKDYCLKTLISPDIKDTELTILELSLMLYPHYVEKAILGIQDKKQKGYAKRIFFIQLEVWRHKNKVMDEFYRYILKESKEDILLVPGDEKFIKLERMAKTMGHSSGNPLLVITEDQNRFGDTYPMEVFQIIHQVAFTMGEIPDYLFKLFTAIINASIGRLILIPLNTANLMRLEIKRSMHLSDTKSDSKVFVKEDLRKTLISFMDKYLIDQGTWLFSTFANFNKKHTAMDQINDMTMKKEVGFTLGVLNVLGSIGTAAHCQLINYVLQYIGLDNLTQSASHSDDSITFAAVEVPKVKTFRKLLFPDVRERLLKGEKINGDQRNGFYWYKGEEKKDSVSSQVISKIICALAIFSPRVVGQKPSLRKYRIARTGEILQASVIDGSFHIPVARYTFSIGAETYNKSPSSDLLSMIGRLNPILSHSTDLQLVNDIIMLLNWNIYYRFRIPLQEVDSSLPTELFGVWYSLPHLIFKFGYSANLIRLLNNSEGSSFLTSALEMLMNEETTWKQRNEELETSHVPTSFVDFKINYGRNHKASKAFLNFVSFMKTDLIKDFGIDADLNNREFLKEIGRIIFPRRLNKTLMMRDKTITFVETMISENAQDRYLRIPYYVKLTQMLGYYKRKISNKFKLIKDASDVFELGDYVRFLRKSILTIKTSELSKSMLIVLKTLYRKHINFVRDISFPAYQLERQITPPVFWYTKTRDNMRESAFKRHFDGLLSIYMEEIKNKTPIDQSNYVLKNLDLLGSIEFYDMYRQFKLLLGKLQIKESELHKYYETIKSLFKIDSVEFITKVSETEDIWIDSIINKTKTGFSIKVDTKTKISSYELGKNSTPLKLKSKLLIIARLTSLSDPKTFPPLHVMRCRYSNNIYQVVKEPIVDPVELRNLITIKPTEDSLSYFLTVELIRKIEILKLIRKPEENVYGCKYEQNILLVQIDNPKTESYQLTIFTNFETWTEIYFFTSFTIFCHLSNRYRNWFFHLTATTDGNFRYYSDLDVIKVPQTGNLPVFDISEEMLEGLEIATKSIFCYTFQNRRVYPWLIQSSYSNSTIYFPQTKQEILDTEVIENYKSINIFKEYLSFINSIIEDESMHISDIQTLANILNILKLLLFPTSMLVVHIDPSNLQVSTIISNLNAISTKWQLSANDVLKFFILTINDERWIALGYKFENNYALDSPNNLDFIEVIKSNIQLQTAGKIQALGLTLGIRLYCSLYFPEIFDFEPHKQDDFIKRIAHSKMSIREKFNFIISKEIKINKISDTRFISIDFALAIINLLATNDQLKELLQNVFMHSLSAEYRLGREMKLFLVGIIPKYSLTTEGLLISFVNSI